MESSIYKFIDSIVIKTKLKVWLTTEFSKSFLVNVFE